MVRYGRGEDGVYRDPIPFVVRIRMVLILLLLVGAIAFLAVRGCRAGAAVAPAQGPVRISCVGDSITYGFGLADREHECWTFLLEGRLPEGSSVGNYGVSGSCAMSCGYYPWTRTAQSHVFWEAEEDVVILMLGTNDVADSAWDAGAFEQSFEELVDRILAKPGHPRLIIMLPPHVFASPTMNERLESEAIPAMRRVAQRSDAGIVDLYTLTDSHPEWFDDGLHPNAEGNEAIEAAVAEALGI